MTARDIITDVLPPPEQANTGSRLMMILVAALLAAVVALIVALVVKNIRRGPITKMTDRRPGTDDDRPPR